MKKIYISLGQSCNPRIKIKYKFKLSKKNGYKTCPFDLCITNFYALIKTLESNFKNFYEGLKIKGGTITNNNGILFNHESSYQSHLFRNGTNDKEFYTRNNFKEFKIRYDRRIRNFKEYLKLYKNIVFIYQDKNNNFKKDLVIKHITKHYGKKTIDFYKVM
tara:strand:+ start:189 stop:671 length:483 start_codon:yes stop_codon:yes gene_type:complete